MKTKRVPGGPRIPILGIGTFGIGGEHTRDDSDDTKNIKAVRNAIKLGYTHIDTSEVYGAGHSEELIGKAIKGLDRKKLFITTKVYKNHLKYDDVIKSAKASMKRMGIEYIDLYLIHVPNPKIPIKETISAMDFLVDKGLVKYIGVSNFSKDQVKEAQKCTKHKIVANQIKHNLWAKFIDIESIKYCQNNNIMVIAHKPFGKGKIITNKIPLLSELAKKYKKTEAQIVLSWLMSRKNTVVIFKSVQLKHLKENLGALKFRLTESDCKKLNSLMGF
jgi:diketogulonate reductase-like aldo/keto reductase